MGGSILVSDIELSLTTNFSHRKVGLVRRGFWALAPDQKARSKCVETRPTTGPEIRANGQRTNAADFRVLSLPKRKEFWAAEFDLIEHFIHVFPESVNRAKSERKIGRICSLSKFSQLSVRQWPSPAVTESYVFRFRPSLHCRRPDH